MPRSRRDRALAEATGAAVAMQPFIARLTGETGDADTGLSLEERREVVALIEQYDFVRYVLQQAKLERVIAAQPALPLLSETRAPEAREIARRIEKTAAADDLFDAGSAPRDQGGGP
jgi:hypothetical protein